MNDAYALLAKIETLSSLLRATSELGSSVPTHDERVRDLIRLIDLATGAAEQLERRAGDLVRTLIEPASETAAPDLRRAP